MWALYFVASPKGTGRVNNILIFSCLSSLESLHVPRLFGAGWRESQKIPQKPNTQTTEASFHVILRFSLGLSQFVNLQFLKKVTTPHSLFTMSAECLTDVKHYLLFGFLLCLVYSNL